MWEVTISCCYNNLFRNEVIIYFAWMRTLICNMVNENIFNYNKQTYYEYIFILNYLYVDVMKSFLIEIKIKIREI